MRIPHSHPPYLYGTGRFLANLTNGKLNISKDMISKLSKEFANKSEQERKKIYSDTLLSPVMHADCTHAKAYEMNVYVFVCATSDGSALYQSGRFKNGALPSRKWILGKEPMN